MVEQKVFLVVQSRAQVLFRFIKILYLAVLIYFHSFSKDADKDSGFERNGRSS